MKPSVAGTRAVLARWGEARPARPGEGGREGPSLMASRKIFLEALTMVWKMRLGLT